ncbi:MAG: fibrillin [Leptolyngbyaceae cyanobacterium SM1_4_3]|nr:fibrillin [Leptolyngbyaceae cyanobacterium SM1_4_3]NJN91837.1 fibrillin [Leptolyngbyaceae cyanobacterium SL_5_14]
MAGKNRGLLTTELDKLAILSVIAQLEDQNPNPRPLEVSDKLDGNWRLLYTTSQDLLRIDQLPLFKLGQIYQYIRAREARIYNVAEVYGLPYLEGLISVAARFEPVSDRRVQVKFERSILGLQRLINYQSAQHFVEAIESGQKFTAIDFNITNRDQQGWLDITYLDDDLRIGRGNEGSVFVLTRN